MPRKPAVGIDLGTTYSCVAVMLNGKVEIVGNDLGHRITPSCVAFTENERLIGNAAKNQKASNPLNTIYDVKRIIGRQYNDETIQSDIKSWPFEVSEVDGKIKIKAEYKGNKMLFSPEEISAMVLTKMKETAETFLHQKVSDVVITVPAYFTEVQRQATKDAGTIAGLNVLRLISEPTAVALAYGVDKTVEGNKTVLIFDFGGGTLDVSIVKIVNGKEFEVKSTSGNTHLGGVDIDHKLKEHFIKDIKKKCDEDISDNSRAVTRLLIACENAKVELSSKMETTINIDALFQGQDYSTKLSRAAFEEVCDDIFSAILKPVEEALQEANLEKKQIDQVILAGGTTRIPKVQAILTEYFDGKQLNKTINPDEAIAYGAALQAGMLTDNMGNSMKPVKLIDVTPLTLGTGIIGGLFSPIIKRNSQIPTKHTERYETIKDNQESIDVEIYQGERQMVKDLNFLGRIQFTDIPRAPCGEVTIDVTFSIDVNGILSVSVLQPTTGKSVDLLIENANGRLSKSEISKMLEDAENFKCEDEQKKEKIEARNNLEDYIYKVKRSADTKKMSDKDKKEILTACDSIKDWLENNTEPSVEEIKDKLKELKLSTSIMLK